MKAKASMLRFSLSLAQRAGYNQLVINSDNLELIDTVKNGERSARVAATVFDDCYLLVIFISLVSNIVIEKQIRLLTSLPRWLDFFYF